MTPWREPARPYLLPRSLGDPEPLTPRRLAWLHRQGLPLSVIAGRFQLARERIAGLLAYYGLAATPGCAAKRR